MKIVKRIAAPFLILGLLAACAANTQPQQTTTVTPADGTTVGSSANPESTADITSTSATTPPDTTVTTPIAATTSNTTTSTSAPPETTPSLLFPDEVCYLSTVGEWPYGTEEVFGGDYVIFKDIAAGSIYTSVLNVRTGEVSKTVRYSNVYDVNIGILPDRKIYHINEYNLAVEFLDGNLTVTYSFPGLSEGDNYFPHDCAVLSSDGLKLIYTDDGIIYIYDLASGTEEQVETGFGPLCFCLVSGNTAYFNSSDTPTIALDLDCLTFSIIDKSDFYYKTDGVKTLKSFLTPDLITLLNNVYASETYCDSCNNLYVYKYINGENCGIIVYDLGRSAFYTLPVNAGYVYISGESIIFSTDNKWYAWDYSASEGTAFTPECLSYTEMVTQVDDMVDEICRNYSITVCYGNAGNDFCSDKYLSETVTCMLDIYYAVRTVRDTLAENPNGAFNEIVSRGMKIFLCGEIYSKNIPAATSTGLKAITDTVGGYSVIALDISSLSSSSGLRSALINSLTHIQNSGGTVTPNENPTDTEATAQIDAVVDEIYQNYGITVYYSLDGNNFSLHKYLSEVVTNMPDIYQAVCTLRDTLAEYPDGIFVEMCKGCSRGIKIYLCGNLLQTGSSYTSLPYAITTENDGYSIIAADISSASRLSSLRTTLIGELMHIMDGRISVCEENTRIPYLRYWQNNFESSAPSEDRAQIIETLMGTEDGMSYVLGNEALLKKARYLCVILRECFESVKNAENIPWERCLNGISYDEFADVLIPSIILGL